MLKQNKYSVLFLKLEQNWKATQDIQKSTSIFGTKRSYSNFKHGNSRM